MEAQETGEHRAGDGLLERFKLDAKKDDFAGTLSGGQRKLLEMARALMSEPKVVMLDEPMAGVNPALTQSLLGHVKDLREQGMTVIFVEHDMDVVRDISDWVVVMAAGRSSPRARRESISRTRPWSTPTSARTTTPRRTRTRPQSSWPTSPQEAEAEREAAAPRPGTRSDEDRS